MKRLIFGIMTVAASLVTLASCSEFLKEEPKTFLQPGNYYTNEEEVRMGANGAYYGYRMMLNGTGMNSGGEVVCMTELMCGYAEREASHYNDVTEIFNGEITALNGFAAGPWGTLYGSLNNVNTMIQVLETKTDIDITDAARNHYLGEMYFLRGLYYSYLVRYYGPVPLKLTPTTGFADAQMPTTPATEVMGQVVTDLETAESLMEKAGAAWNSTEGRVSLGAVKAFLAKMYLTQAGYPTQDKSFYKKAYDKAKEVVQSGAFSLYDTYAAAHNGYDTNGKEYLLSVQCMKDQFENPLHMVSVARPGGLTLQPYISLYDATRPGGGWKPHASFFASYASGDKRTEDGAYYYTSMKSLDGTVTHTFSPNVYKYWDEDAKNDAKSGKNFPLIRYTDVLLTLAEAACAGGTTTDAAAIDAYWQVRKRAMPNESKPTSLSFDTVFKERIWEQAFDGENWFNMIRTRKAFDFGTGRVVDLIGYKAPAISKAFTEDFLLLPYPVEQVRLNPNLKR